MNNVLASQFVVAGPASAAFPIPQYPPPGVVGTVSPATTQALIAVTNLSTTDECYVSVGASMGIIATSSDTAVAAGATAEINLAGGYFAIVSATANPVPCSVALGN